MATEDYTAYTHVDPSSTVGVTSTALTGVAVPDNEDNYTYKDYGVDHFVPGMAAHLWDFSNDGTGGAKWFPWILANTVDDAGALKGTDGYACEVSYKAGNATPKLNNYFNATKATLANLSNTTTYYSKITWTSGGTLTWLIYSDSARTNLVTSGAVTSATTKTRYHYGINNENKNKGKTSDGTSSNIDLQEASGVDIVVPLATMSLTNNVPSVASGKSVAVPLDTITFTDNVPTIYIGSGGSVTFTASAVDSVNRGTYTFSAVSIGTAASDRKVVVSTLHANAAQTITAVTVGGISATSVVVLDVVNAMYIELWQADVPTGTTADIVVTSSGTADRMGIGVWDVKGVVGPAHATATSSADPMSATIDVPANGICIGAVTNDTTGEKTLTWTNLTEDYDELVEAGTEQTGASKAFVNKQTALSITCTPSSSTFGRAMVLASWAPPIDIMVPLATLTLADNAPAVGTSAAVTSPLSSISLTNNAPAVASGASAAVPLNAISFSNLVPAVGTSVAVTSPLSTISLSNNIPAVATGANAAVPLNTISITDLVPAVGTSVALTVPLDVLSIANGVPAVVTGASVAVPLNAISFSNLVPAVGTSALVTVPLNVLSFTNLAPGVASGKNVAVPTDTISLNNLTPAVGTSVLVTVPLNTLSVLNFVPAVASGKSVTVPLDAVTITNLIPSVAAGGIIIDVPLNAMTIADQTPVVGTGIFMDMPIDAITITDFAPTVSAIVVVASIRPPTGPLLNNPNTMMQR